MAIATEIVKMKMAPGVTKEDFFETILILERDFHAKQPGFMDTELLYDDRSEEWIMVQHWDTMEHLKAASKNMFHDERTASFLKSLNPSSVKMLQLPQIKKWGVKR